MRDNVGVHLQAAGPSLSAHILNIEAITENAHAGIHVI